MRLSLLHGGGDLRWFDKLEHEDQVAILAYHRAQERPATSGAGGNLDSRVVKGTSAGRAFFLGGGGG